MNVTEALRQLLFAAENKSGNESLTSAIHNAKVALHSSHSASDVLERWQAVNIQQNAASLLEHHNYPAMAVAVRRVTAFIEAQAKEIKAHQKEKDECEQIAGKALGYPWYKDDQKNFPGATEGNGVCIGEHVTSTIVAELARAYEETRIALNEAKEDRSFE